MTSVKGSPEIYLDNAATTPLRPAALRAMMDCSRRFYGNPSSWHRKGVEASRAVEKSRRILALALGCEPDEIVFTSGGTEANNLAVKGVARALGRRRAHAVVSAVEHPSVAAAVQSLKARGWSITVVKTDEDGMVAPRRVAEALTSSTALVSVMHANHEIGTIEPIAEIGRLCRRAGVLFHSDACQSFMKEPLDLRRVAVDLVSVNAHKLHGPKGVGALVARRGSSLAPLLDGGGQEGGRRSGTHNTPAIAGFAAAVEDSDPGAPEKMRRLRDRLFAALVRTIPGLSLNGPRHGRLCSHLNLLLPGLQAKPFLQKLSAAGIYASAGAACSSAKTTPSPVLLAIGRTPEQASCSVRLSLSRSTTPSQIDAAARTMASLARGL